MTHKDSNIYINGLIKIIWKSIDNNILGLSSISHLVKRVKFVLPIFITMCFLSVLGQENRIITPEVLLQEAKYDTSKLNKLNEAAYDLRLSNPDSTIKLSFITEQYARDLKFEKGIGDALMMRGIGHTSKGNYLEAIDYFLEGQNIFNNNYDLRRVAALNNNIGRVYNFLEEYDLAMDYYNTAAEQFEKVGNISRQGMMLNNVGYIYRLQKDYTQSLQYLYKAKEKANLIGNREGLIYPLYNIGGVYALTQEPDSAFIYLNRALSLAQEVNDKYITSLALIDLGKLNVRLNNRKQALTNFQEAFQTASEIGLRAEKSEAALQLSLLYEISNNEDKALFYLKEHKQIQDSLFNKDKIRKIALLEAEFKSNQEKLRMTLELEKAELEKEKRLTNIIWTRNTLIIGIIAMMIISYLLYKNYSRKHRANLQLQALNEQIARQKQDLEIQANDLRESNERIKALSANLEQIVEKRTRTLEQRNEMLKKYLHSNSHEVRAPLARILALVHIYQKDKAVGEIDVSYLMDNIVKSAQELDDVIRKINDNLQD